MIHTELLENNLGGFMSSLLQAVNVAANECDLKFRNCRTHEVENIYNRIHFVNRIKKVYKYMSLKFEIIRNLPNFDKNSKADILEFCEDVFESEDFTKYMSYQSQYGLAERFMSGQALLWIAYDMCLGIRLPIRFCFINGQYSLDDHGIRVYNAFKCEGAEGASEAPVLLSPDEYTIEGELS